MHINFHLTPTDVSFNKIKVQEQAVAPATKTGVFDDGQAHNHPAWPNQVAVGNGNIATGCLVKGPNAPAGACTKHFDAAGGSVPATTSPKGTLVWNIPWKYFVGGESKVFATVPQYFLWKEAQHPAGMLVVKGSNTCGAVATKHPD